MTDIREITVIDNREGAHKAYEGSYYCISGAGGDLQEWVTGYEDLMAQQEIGKPTEWFSLSGALLNAYAGVDQFSRDAYPTDTICLLFPLTGLNIARLPIFKIQMSDRWFDDIIDNMRG
jgi:hypothetical protein